MRRLSARDVLEIWDQAAGRPRLDRALISLRAAWKEEPWEDLVRLPVGRRDARLLELYRNTFGPELDLFVACPGCGEGQEPGLTVDDLLARLSPPQGFPRKGTRGEWPPELAAGDLRLRFRLPDSSDLAASARCPDAASGLLLLLERCLLEARRDGSPIDAGDLGEDEIAALAAAMAKADPAAEILLDLICPACGHAWTALLDIGECLWHQITAGAGHLLLEVSTLARTHGWREADILAMSPKRRQAYLELLAG